MGVSNPMRQKKDTEGVFAKRFEKSKIILLALKQPQTST